jgi:hypothetical protein
MSIETNPSPENFAEPSITALEKLSLESASSEKVTSPLMVATSMRIVLPAATNTPTAHEYTQTANYLMKNEILYSMRGK